MRALEFITELFKSGKQNWKWRRQSSDEAFASFVVADREYQWHAFSSEANPAKWEIQFRLMRASTDPDGLDLFGKTGTGNSAQVLSTAVDITRSFLQTYGLDKVEEITFNAKEDSRINLYVKMIRRLLPDWDLSSRKSRDKGMQFTLTDTRAYDKPENKIKDPLKELFAPGGNDEDSNDPYQYPKPEHYARSIDFFGQFEAEHFDKEDMNDATGEFKGYWDYDGKLRQIAYFKFDNTKRTGSNHPGMGWYYEPQNEDVAGSSLNEFAPGEGGFGPFKVYISNEFIEEFPTFDQAKEEIDFLRTADPKSFDADWKIIDGTGKTVWQHDPGEAIDAMRMRRKIQFNKPDNNGVAEGLEFFSMPLRMSEYRGKTHPATNQPYDAKFKFSGDLKDRVHSLLDAGTKPTLLQVNPRHLLATQDWLSTQGGGKPAFATMKQHPVVLQKNNKLYILDGHHRSADAHKSGTPIQVYLFKDEL